MGYIIFVIVFMIFYNIVAFKFWNRRNFKPKGVWLPIVINIPVIVAIVLYFLTVLFKA
jgi:hypothetical protein